MCPMLWGKSPPQNGCLVGFFPEQFDTCDLWHFCHLKHFFIHMPTDTFDTFEISCLLFELPVSSLLFEKPYNCTNVKCVKYVECSREELPHLSWEKAESFPDWMWVFHCLPGFENHKKIKMVHKYLSLFGGHFHYKIGQSGNFWGHLWLQISLGPYIYTHIYTQRML